MNEEKYEDGISITELLAIVWKRKIIISAIVLATMIIFAMVTLLFINPTKTIYSAKYELTFPGIEDENFPSGLMYDYRLVISSENIKNTILTNDDFSYLELNESDFTVSQSAIVSSNNEVKTRLYEIQASASKFKNDDSAKDFISCLVNMHYSEVLLDVNKLYYGAYIDNAIESNSYSKHLEYLYMQENYINEKFDEIISIFGDVSIEFQGETYSLSTKKIHFESYFSNINISILESELKYNDYIKCEENLLEYENEALVLQSQIDLLNNKIEALREQVEYLLTFEGNSTTTPEISGFVSLIGSAVIQREELQYNLGLVQSKINNATISGSEQYNDKVEDVTDLIKEKTDEFTLLTKTLYSNFINLKFDDNTNVVITSNSVSVVLASLVGVVLSGGVSCVIFIAIDLMKQNKTKED